MSIARLQLPLEVANDQPWAEDFRFWSDQAKTQPASITSALGKLKAQNSTAPVFLLSTSNGRVLVNSGVVGLRVTLVDMAGLPPGAYDFELQATDSSGGVRQIRGIVHIVAGLS